MADLAYSHPELARRYTCLVERCWARGWDIGITSSSRSYQLQKEWFRQYMLGQFPNLVADPDRDAGPSPWGWEAWGSMHMVQEDGHSHALDLYWQLPGAHVRDLHSLCHSVGLRFPEPTENWHMQWWDPWAGIYPIDDPSALPPIDGGPPPPPPPVPNPLPDPTAGDDVTKEEFADWIGATIAPAGDEFAGKVCVPLLNDVQRDENGAITATREKLFPLASAISYGHKEGKLARLQRPGNTELS